jgi:predicted SnoaL-like aldol condensation-catalyzing enzyme
MNKIDVVKNYWASESAKNLPEILSWFAQEAAFCSPGMELNGREQIRKFYQGMIDNYSEVVVTVTNYIEQEDQIAVEYHVRLVKNDTVKIARGFNIFRIKENLIHELRCYFNPNDF